MGKDSTILKSITAPRRRSKVIKIGDLQIGGDNPIAIQSMTKTQTSNIEATLKQIRDLEKVGCEIIRLAVRDFQDARAIKKIKRFCSLPLVADIHFDWRLAITAIDNGIDKIRLNPGNIYNISEIGEIVRAAKASGIPIRIGVNSGSLRRAKGQGPRTRYLADTMVTQSLEYIKILERFKFHDIVVSLKASDIFDTIVAYRKMSKICDYPLHLGLTATGLPLQGAVKSSIAIGTLLSEGIGDTIRVSLTDDPQEEVKIARFILETLGLRCFGPEIISCPTCGRCEVNLVKIIKDLGEGLSTINHKLSAPSVKLAVMGCLVNGPGEAKDADLGIAFGKKQGLLFKRGKPLKKVGYKDCISVLLKEIRSL